MPSDGDGDDSNGADDELDDIGCGGAETTRDAKTSDSVGSRNWNPRPVAPCAGAGDAGAHNGVSRRRRTQRCCADGLSAWVYAADCTIGGGDDEKATAAAITATPTGMTLGGGTVA